MNDPTRFSIIIPAYNEEAVIRRCLRSIRRGLPTPCATQIIVAANGCTDRTVQFARLEAPEAIILDLPEGSKPAALNAANAKAEFFPRIFLDADVECDYPTLAAVAEVLRKPAIMAASPAIELDLSRSSSLVQAYYRVWMTQPYVTNGMVGSGCYGLSRSAIDKIGPFPQIIGDDIWVHSRFSPSERCSVAQDGSGRPVRFIVSPPRNVCDQIRVEARRRLGNRELKRKFPSEHYTGSNSFRDLPVALRGGASIFDIAVYLMIKGSVYLRAWFLEYRSKEIVWERDHSARET